MTLAGMNASKGGCELSVASAYALFGLGGALVHRAVGEACQRLDEAAATFRDLAGRVEQRDVYTV